VIARILTLAALGVLPAAAQDISRPQPARPGIEFQGADVRKLQSDDFANPGMLAVARGERLWGEKLSGSDKPCAVCHGDATKSMKGVATRYPRFDPSPGRVVDLEGRIDACKRENAGGAALAPESADLVALTAFVAHQSRGLPMAVTIEGPAHATFERGAALYRTRIGQMNLACMHCHDANWGKTLLAEPISQGHPTGWPAYRLEWQATGSLQRRLRACFFGVRAEQPAYGSDDLVSLELYLAARAQGLAIEAPGVRR
jgi:L-cysteine S-thiosulfotransferase